MSANGVGASMSLQGSPLPRASDRHGFAPDGRAGDRPAEFAQRRPAAIHDAPYHPDQAPPLRREAPPQRPRAAPRDYTIGHGGRQVRVGPVAFWICVGTLVIMAGWSAVTGTYFAFHDDVLARLIARQAAMQFAYEDRIAEMRAQVDRVTSRQLLDQEQFESRLDQLSKRQTAIEARASSLGAITDQNVTGSIKAPTRSIAPGGGPLKPSPMNGTSMFSGPLEREATLIPRSAPRMTINGVAGTLTRLEASLGRVEAGQNASLNALESTYEGKLSRMRSALAEVGLSASARAASDSATGGPFVPYRLPANAGAFERQVHRIAIARAQADRLTRLMTAVPLRQPVTGELEQSSGFGVRIDPFVGRPAMHTGVDFRGEPGEPVHATASGTVTSAGWSGGYGRMIEIDHGNGLATRYGHLSEIEVHPGETIRIGQVIGRVGSTGRSTGPHLHYETRVHGEAVDPDKFLRAGMHMGFIQ
jgi:murein DD-endopeptidase MepM/ murein hydrolase activator NlpD